MIDEKWKEIADTFDSLPGAMIEGYAVGLVVGMLVIEAGLFIWWVLA